MELRQIRYFVAIAEEGSFSGASRKLFVSQPPITRQMQQLEAELGVQLFERVQKGVTLTAAGEAFLEEARQVLTHSYLAVERSQAAADGKLGKIEIGYFGSPIYSIIPAVVRQFCADNPRANVSLQPISKREQPDAILDGRIHVGFGRHFPNTKGIVIETLLHERIVVAFAADSSLARFSGVTPKRLVAEPMIVFPRTGRPSFADEVIRLVREQGLEPDIVYEAADLSSAMAMVAAGRGVCPVPDSVTQLAWPEVSFLPIRKVSARSPINFIYSSDNDSPLLQAFIDSLRKKFGKP